MRIADPLFKADSAQNQIIDIAYSFQKSRVFLTAIELDLFTILDNKNGMTAKEVSEVLNTNLWATSRLLNALCAIGLCFKEVENYFNEKDTSQFLVKGKPDFINLNHLVNSWDYWGSLTDSVRLGTAANLPDNRERTNEKLEDFISAMHYRAYQKAKDVVLLIDFEPFSKILDLGGGSGAYAIQFAKSKPEVNVTIYDLPDIIPITNSYVKRSGMAHKINTCAGNFLTDDIGKGYDLVFVSQVFHNYSIWENIELTKKIYDCLRPGGTIVIQESLVNDKRTAPEYTVIYSLDLLINTMAGDTLTETDLWIILKESWFSLVKRIDTEYGTSLIIAKR